MHSMYFHYLPPLIASASTFAELAIQGLTTEKIDGTTIPQTMIGIIRMIRMIRITRMVRMMECLA